MNLLKRILILTLVLLLMIPPGSLDGVYKVSAEPVYELATDDDFSGTSIWDFRYIGPHEYVEIPHTIKGVNVTSYSGMFQGYKGSQLKGVKSTNSNVTDMSNMFADASGLTELDLSNFDTSNVTDMRNIFSGTSGLTELDLSNFDTSKVTNMRYMFHGAGSLTSLDLSHFDTSNVTDMIGMFHGASSLTELDLSNFDTSKVSDMSGMFRNVSSLTELDLSKFDTSKVTSMIGMFSGASNLTELDLSSFDTGKVTNMNQMFANASGLTSLDLSNFDTSNVTDMSLMFDGANGLAELDLSSFDTSNVTNMGNMFSSASNLTELDLSNSDTSNVTNMSSMFAYASSLTKLDLSSFDTSNVTNMSYMFENASSLTELDLSNFDTSNVTDMYEMFYGVSSLTELDLSNFDTSKVTDMYGMFYGVSSLTELDLSNFDTSNVTDMYGMFWGASSLTELDLSSFDTSKVTNMGNMFRDVKAIEGYAGTQEDANRFNGSSNKPVTLVFKVLPSIKFMVDGNNTYQKEHGTQVNVNWSGGAQESLQYVWSTAATTPINGWANFNSGNTLKQSTGTGNYYLYVKARSKQGLESTAVSEAFKLDNTPPGITVSPSTTSPTNKNVVVTVKGTDSHSGVDYIRQSGVSTKHNSATKDFSISNNGTYTFRVYDKAGNVSSESITINNIDKVKPKAPKITAPPAWQKDNVSVTIAHGSDSGGSGVDYTEYQIGSGSWTKYSSGVSISSAGETTIKARTVDKAGNVSSQATATIKIDKTSPTVSFATNGGSWKKSHSTKVDISDSGGSGLKSAKYQWTTSSSFPTSGTFTNVTNGTTLSAPTATGNHYLHIEATDGAGNVTKLTSNVFRVDNTNPEVTLSANIKSTTHENVVITAKVSDKDSGVKEVIMPDKSIGKGGSNKTFTATKNGTYEFTVVDNAGNETKKSYKVDNIVRELSLGGVSTSLSSISSKIESEASKSPIQINDVIITDWRDEVDNDWELTLSSKNLSNNKYSYGNGTISFGGVNSVNDVNVDSRDGIHFQSDESIIDDGDVLIIKGEKSRGEFKVDFKDDTVNFNIDPADARVGSYKTTLTWTLSSTPTIN